MRFLCDVHIPIKLSKYLVQLGHFSEHVNNILDGSETHDEDIVVYVEREEMILITKDQDFRNSYLLKRSPRKLLKIDLGNIPNEILLKTIETHLNQISELNERCASFMIEVNKSGYLVVTK